MGAAPLPLVALLTIGLCSASPSPAAPGNILTEPPRAINVTNSTLTMALGAPCVPPCYAQWQIKERNFSEWKSLHFTHTTEVVITDLKEATVYEVRAPVEFDPNQPLKENASVAEISTCPSHPPSVYHFYTTKRGSNVLMVSWSSEDDCDSDGYYLWWTAYENTNIEDTYLPPFFDAATRCNSNATLITNLTAIKCQNYHETYCYSITDVLPRTRYSIKIQKVNWRGECSFVTQIETATAIALWGGISVKEWSLLFVCIGVLICAVPSLLLFKRRVAERMTTRRGVTFRRDEGREDAVEEDHDAGADHYLISEASARVQLAEGTPPLDTRGCANQEQNGRERGREPLSD